MGATAFALLGGECDRSFEHWEAGEELYEVALKAVEPNRENRYGSVSGFKLAWDAAVNPSKEVAELAEYIITFVNIMRR